MWRQLLEVVTLGLYDPMKRRITDAEQEIDRLKVKAQQFDALHQETDSHDRNPH